MEFKIKIKNLDSYRNHPIWNKTLRNSYGIDKKWNRKMLCKTSQTFLSIGTYISDKIYDPHTNTCAQSYSKNKIEQ